MAAAWQIHYVEDFRDRKLSQDDLFQEFPLLSHGGGVERGPEGRHLWYEGQGTATKVQLSGQTKTRAKFWEWNHNLGTNESNSFHVGRSERGEANFCQY